MHVRVALGILAVLPVACLLLNPMLLMFLTPVTVVNRTATALHVVPVSRGETGFVRRSALVANAETSFVYDWDDDNLCWLAVRAGDGGWKVAHGPMAEMRVCAVVEHSDAGCCSTADDFRFTVEAVESLEDAPAWMQTDARLDR